MFRFFIRIILFVLILFVLPGLVHLGLWSLKDQPARWNVADWSSAGIISRKPPVNDARVYVMSARTGGLKGAFATHSWIVLKKPGARGYDRYDVVGWGTPVRHNAYDADGRWYSNLPVIQYTASGQEAAQLIPKIEKAIANYRWRQRGDYTLWPGPNSNTFVASIIRAVPGFDAQTPSTAVGRDFPEDGRWLASSKGAWRATLGGYAGLVIGSSEGLELNFLGLVAGINPLAGEIKVPAFGTFRW